MTNSNEIPIQDSIATLLLKVVFSIYFLVTLSVTLVHMGAEYQATKNGIHKDLKVFHKTFEPSLAGGLWDLDPRRMQDIISGMIELRGIVGVKVLDDKGRVYAMGGTVLGETGELLALNRSGRALPPSADRGLFSDLFHSDFPIFHDEARVGTLALYSSKSVIIDEVSLGFMFIIVNSIIKTIALWVIFLWAARILLNRPLAILTKATGELELDKLDGLRIDVKTSGRNELKVLEEAFNNMVSKLIMARERTASLRRFSSQIGEYLDQSAAQQFAFREISSNVINNGGVFFSSGEQGQMLEYSLYNTRQGFILPSSDVPKIQKLLRNQPGCQSVDEEDALAVFNWITPGDKTHTALCSTLNHELQAGHYMIVEVAGKGVNFIGLHRSTNNPIFDSADVEYVLSMLNEVVLARRNINSIQDHARMEGELRTAAVVQHALFPKVLPTAKNLEMGAYFRSAAETGGDWYGFMTQFHGQLYFLIGDVTGHGTPAALVTATAFAATRVIEEMFNLRQTLSGAPPTPAECLHYLNQAIYEVGSPNFLMTFLVLRLDLDTGHIVFSNAGHNFPIIVRESGQLDHLLNANVQLGFRQDWEFTQAECNIAKGDTLFLYTDGLIENLNPKDLEFGRKNLMTSLKRNRKSSAKEIVDDLIREAHVFYEERSLDDDMTVVACKIIDDFPKIMTEDSTPIEHSKGGATPIR